MHTQYGSKSILTLYNQNFIDNGDKAINCDKNALNINALVLDLNNLF